MKKILLSIFIVLLFSCSNEEISETNQDAQKNKNSELLKITGVTSCLEIQQNSSDFLLNTNCSINFQNPFVSQTNMYSYPANLNYDKFADKLQEYVFREVNGFDLGASGRPTSRTLVSSLNPNGYDYVYLSTIIDLNGTYPLISPEKANIVYSNIACKYKNQINDLNISNPLLQGKYVVEFNYILVDSTICGGVENTYVQIAGSIYKYTF